MNMLEALLRTCDLESYLPNFKKLDIDAFTLKILKDEDLKIIGIEDEDTRKVLLQRAANLQIPFEKFVQVNIDKQYIHLVLNQAAIQIPKISAVLAVALKRENILICDVKMSKAVKCLRSCVSSLEKQIEEFDKNLMKEKKKNKAKYLVIPATIFATGVLLFIYSLKLSRLK